MRQHWFLHETWQDGTDEFNFWRYAAPEVWFAVTSAREAEAQMAASAQPWYDWHNRHAVPTTFTQTNLISDGSVQARTTDPNLINPWGVSYGSVGTGGEFWISDAGTGVTTIDAVTASGVVTLNLFPPVTIPAAAPGGNTSEPTGQVYNSFLTTNAFMLPDGSPATFLFATADGTISGWNISAHSQAIVVVDEPVDPNQGESRPVYKGLAIGQSSTGPVLYAADFRHGTVDMYDQNFNEIKSFNDPNLPEGYAPFNVKVLGDKLFVTFALQNDTKDQDVAGAGHGFVDEFDLQGYLLNRVASAGSLDSPWGMAFAPASFGTYAGDLLVGNFGDGTINAYDLNHDGAFVGKLTYASGNPFVALGLWELIPGNSSGGLGGDPNAIYFTAGLQNQAHGLFGELTANATPTPPAMTGGLWNLHFG